MGVQSIFFRDFEFFLGVFCCSVGHQVFAIRKYLDFWAVSNKLLVNILIGIEIGSYKLPDHAIAQTRPYTNKYFFKYINKKQRCYW